MQYEKGPPDLSNISGGIISLLDNMKCLAALSFSSGGIV